MAKQVSMMPLLVAISIAFLSLQTWAADYYWDINGGGSGSGGPMPSGAWDGVNAFWNSDSAGGAGSFVADPGIANRGVLSAGTDAIMGYFVTISGTRTSGGLLFQEGTVTISGGTSLLLAGDVTQSSSGLAVIRTPLDLNAAGSRTFDVGSGGLTISGSVGNGTNVVKTGMGTLILSGTNTFSGSLRVGAGTLKVGGNNALPGGILFMGNNPSYDATLDLNDHDVTVGGITYYIANNPQNTLSLIKTGTGVLTLGGNITIGDTWAAQNKSITGNLYLNGSRSINVSPSGHSTFTISADISGSAGSGLNYNSAYVVISGVNTYSGTTTLSGGTVGLGIDAVGSVGSITSSPLGTNTLIFAGGGISSDGATPRTVLNPVSFTGSGSIGSASRNGYLTFSGGMNLGGAVRTITLNSDAAFDGVITNTASGAGFIKAGSGRLVIRNTNSTYSSTGMWDGYAGASAGSLLSGTNNVFPDTARLYVAGTGTVDLCGFNDTVGGIFFGVNAVGQTALITTGIGTLTLGGSIDQDSNAFGTKNIAGNLYLSGTRSVNNNGATALYMSANISGAGGAGLTANSGAWLILSGTNTYPGATTINSTGIRFDQALSIGGSGRTVVVGNNAMAAGYPIDNDFLQRVNNTVQPGGVIALAVNSGNDLNFNSDVVGANLTAAYLGATGAFAYSGTLTPNGTTYRLGGAGGTLTMSNVNGLTGANSLIIKGNVNLPVANNFSGGTTITSGTLSVGSDASLGTGTITINGGTIQSLDGGAHVVTNAIALGGDITIGGNGNFTFSNTATTALGATRVFNINSGLTVSVSGALSGAFGITKAGGGTLVLTGASTYTGVTSINAGTLSVSSLNRVSGGSGSSNIGAPVTAGNGTIKIGNGNTAGVLLYTGGGEATDRVIDLAGTSGGATIDQSGSGLLLLSGSPFTASGNGLKTLTLQGSTGGTGEVSAVIVNGGNATAVTKSGSGIWKLSGNNTYTGQTTVNGGTLIISGNPTGTGAVTNNGGVLVISGSLANISAIGVTSGGLLDLDYSLSNTSKFNSAAVLSMGGGTLRLSGGSFTQVVASTTLGAGTANIIEQSGGGSILRMGAITRNSGATMRLTAANIASTTTTNDTTGIIGTWAMVGSDYAVNSGNPEGAGPQCFIAAYTGYSNINAMGDIVPNLPGGNVRINAPGTSGSDALAASVTTNNTLLQNTATPCTIDIAGRIYEVGGISIGGGMESVTVGASAGEGSVRAPAGGDLALVNNSSNRLLTINGAIVDNGTSRLTASGNVVLKGTNTYAGGTGIGGGTLEVGGFGRMPAGGSISIGGGAVLRYNSSVDQSLSGVIAGAGTLVKTNSNVLTLTGVNTYTGGTIVDAGELDLSGNTGNNTSTIRGTLTINNNALVKTFQSSGPGQDGLGYGDVNNSVKDVIINGGTLNNVNQTGIPCRSFTLTGGTLTGAAYPFYIINGNPTFTIMPSPNPSVISSGFAGGTPTPPTSWQFAVADGASTVDLLMSGAIGGGAIPLVKDGAGLMVLTATNTYTGATAIRDGTVQLGNGSNSGSIDGSSGVSVLPGANLAFNRLDNAAFSLPVSGGGGVIQRGAGRLTLSGVNSYTGSTIVSNGTLLVSGASAMPTVGTLGVFAGATLSLADGTARSSSVGGISLAGGMTLAFDWVGSAVDTLTTASIAATTGKVAIVLSPAGSPSGTDLTLVHAAGGLATAGGTSYFLAGNTNFTATLAVTDTDVKVGNYTSLEPLTNAYWYGGQVAAASNAMAITDGSICNWSSIQSAYSSAGLVPGPACAAQFSAAGATMQHDVVLGSAMMVGSIGVDDPAGLILNADGYMLTIAKSAGILVGNGAGAVTISAPISLGASQCWKNSSSNLLTVAGVVLNGTSTLTFDGEGNVMVSGSIAAGSGGLVKNGAGTLALCGTNSYAGITAVNSGSVRIRTSTALGTTAGGTVVTNGGELQIEGDGLNFGEALTISGAGMATGGALRNLAGTNTWGGAITLGTGGTRIASDGGLLILTNGVNGSVAGQSLVMGGDGNLTVQTVKIGANVGSITKDGSGKVILAASANAHTGATTINGGTLEIGVAGSLTTQNQPCFIAGGASLRFNTSASHTLSGAISGEGSLLQSGNGSILALSGSANTYSGGTSVSGGRLRLDNNVANAMGSTSGTLTVDVGGTLDLNAVSPTVGSLRGTGGTITNSSVATRVLTIGGGDRSGGNFFGVIGGDATHVVSLVKSGAGTNTLSGANSYYGSTLVSGGELMVAGLNGAILNSSGIAISNGAALTISNSVSANNVDRLRDSCTLTMGGGTLQFVNDGGAAEFCETNGTLAMVGGANTVAAFPSAPGHSSIVVFTNMTRTGGATLNFVGTGLGDGTGRNQIMISNQAAGPMPQWVTVNFTNMAYYDATYGVQAAPDSIYSNIAYRSDTILSNSASFVRINLTNATPGYIGLGSPITVVTRLVHDYPMDSTVSNDAMALALGNITINSGAAGLTIGTVAGSGLLMPGVAGGDLYLDNESVTNLVINSAVVNNSSASTLYKSGPGLVILTAPGNSYSGGTIVHAGTLEIGGAGRLGTGTYSGPGTVLGGATLRYNSTANQTNSGVITGAGMLVKTNSNILTLTGVNTYTGGTVVDAGELDLSGNTGNNTSTIRGTLTINNNALVKTFQSSGPGQDGLGFGDVNNSVKDVIINGGTLNNVNQTGIPCRSFTLTGGALTGANFPFNIINGNPTFTIMPSPNPSVISAGFAGGTPTPPTSWQFTVADGAATVDLLMSGALGGGAIPLVKDGAGVMVLTGTNTYTGSTSINAGTLQLGNGTASGSIDTCSGVSVGAAASLVFNRADNAVFSRVVSGAGSLTQRGSGVVSLTGLSSYSGVTTISAGSLNVSTLGNAGASSPIGTGPGGAGSLVIDGGCLQYTGAGTPSTDRLFTIGQAGATLDASGGIMTLGSAGGAVAFSSNTHPASLILSGSGAGMLMASLGDSGAGTNVTQVIKSGTSAWTLGATNSYSGQTSIAGGILYLNGANRTTNVSVLAAATLGGNGSATNAMVIVRDGASIEAGSGGAGSLTLGSLTYLGNGTNRVANIAGYTNTAAVIVANSDGLRLDGGVGIVTIALSGSAPFGSGSAHIIQYTGEIGGAGFEGFSKVLDVAGVIGLGTNTLTLTNNPPYVDVVWSGIDYPVWTGGGDGNWVTGPSPGNWVLASNSNATQFVTNDAVLFDDTAAGTTTVSISSADVAPRSVVFNNSAKTYTLQGAHGITNGIGVNTPVFKRGNGLVAIDVTNKFSGQLTVEAGALAVGMVNNAGSDGPLGNSDLPVILGKAGGSTGTLQYVSANSGSSKALMLAAGGGGVLEIRNADSTLALSSSIGGSGSLTKTGAGTLKLSGTNNYAATLVRTGTLQFSKVKSLYGGLPGSWTPANITVESNAVLAVNLGGFDEFTTSDFDTLRDNAHLGGSTAVAGLKNGSYLGIDVSSGNVTYSSSISDVNGGAGSIGLVKKGTNILTLSAQNTYSGGTVVESGELDLTGSVGNNCSIIRGTLTINAGAVVKPFIESTPGTTGLGFGDIANSVKSIIINGGTLDNRQGTVPVKSVTMTGGRMTGPSYTWYAINGSPTFVTLASSNSAVIDAKFDINSGVTSWPFDVANGAAEVDLLFSGQLSGAVPMVKSGLGTMVFSTNCTYTGGTMVNAGTLLVNNTTGSGTGSGIVDVATGCRLGGTGIIGGTTIIEEFARLLPGGSNTVGVLTLSGSGQSLLFTDNAILDYDVGGSDSAPTSDVVNLSGSASTVVFGRYATINLNRVTGATIRDPQPEFVLFDYTGANPDLSGTTWTINHGNTGWWGGTVVLNTVRKQVVIRGLQPYQGSILIVR